LLFVVVIKDAFAKDGKQQRWQILLLSATHILFLKIFLPYVLYHQTVRHPMWPHNWHWNCNSGFCVFKRLEHDHAVAATCSHISM
jgi:hypothetical protein